MQGHDSIFEIGGKNAHFMRLQVAYQNVLTLVIERNAPSNERPRCNTGYIRNES